MDPIVFSGVADYVAQGALHERPPACLNLVWAGFLQTDVTPHIPFWCLRTGPGENDFDWIDVSGGGAGPTGDPNAIAFFLPDGSAITDNPMFLVDNSDPLNLRLFVNQTGPIPYPPDAPSGSGLQYSSNVASRPALRLSQYGANAGVPNFRRSRAVEPP